MKCKVCDSEFARLGRSRKIYCCQTCKDKADNKKKAINGYAQLYAKDYYQRNRKPPSSSIFVKTCGETGDLFIAHRQTTKYSKQGLKIRCLRLRKESYQPRESVKPCKECGNIFQPIWHSVFCSDTCRDKHNKAKQKEYLSLSGLKSIHKRIRKAKIKGLQIESVNKFKVFEAYSYACALCGIHTPKHLIGSNKANEPTMDHIIPIVDGGAHSYSNIQLLCRHCNCVVKNSKRHNQFIFNRPTGVGHFFAQYAR